jgi:hypothetical protein
MTEKTSKKRARGAFFAFPAPLLTAYGFWAASLAVLLTLLAPVLFTGTTTTLATLLLVAAVSGLLRLLTLGAAVWLAGGFTALLATVLTAGRITFLSHD